MDRLICHLELKLLLKRKVVLNLKQLSIKLKVIILCVMVAISYFVAFSSKNNTSEENKSTFFVWSASDCNGVCTLLGMRTSDAIYKSSDQRVFPIESLENSNYFGLTYPVQSENYVYYTTTDTKTAKSCIVRKTNSEPDWTIVTDEQTGTKNKYYKRNNNWDVLISENGDITYKCVVNDMVYYSVRQDTLLGEKHCEIHAFHLNDKKEEVIITDVCSKSSFDVSSDGKILYVNTDHQIILQDSQGHEENLGTGTTGCFKNDETILLVTDSGLYINSLKENKKNKLCEASGYDIKLSPSSTYAALQYSYENLFGSGIEYDSICIIDLSTGRFQEITVMPSLIYGFAWFNEYFPIL